jgi:hypothetical protein
MSDSTPQWVLEGEEMNALIRLFRKVRWEIEQDSYFTPNDATSKLARIEYWARVALRS